MQIKSHNEQITVWRPDAFPGLELRKGVSVSEPYPKHWHEEFHFCLILSGGGELDYRGERRATPAGSLFIVHPGEVHSNQADAGSSCSFRNLYIEPDTLSRVVRETSTRQRPLPFFSPQPIDDPEITRSYLRLHNNLEAKASRLEQDDSLFGFLGKLTERYSELGVDGSETTREQVTLSRVRDFLEANFAENVSLEELAALVNLSPFHLNRAFCKEFGLPPHAFQTQLRIARAKWLLRQGASISQTAAEVGFVDQSHFTRHFRRLVLITPGHYRRCRKNVQD